MPMTFRQKYEDKVQGTNIRNIEDMLPDFAEMLA